MDTLLISSMEPYTGKTSISLGLGLMLKDRGKRVGYFKPVGTMPVEVGGVICDEDTLFIKEQFGIDEALDSICPMVFSHQLVRESADGDKRVENVVMESYRKVSKERDFLVVEGGPDIGFGRFLGISGPQLSRKMEIPALMVLRYAYPQNIDQALLAADLFGQRLAGVIFNWVPRSQMDNVTKEMEPYLRSRGIPTFAVLPRDRTMWSVSVADLAEHLQGEFLAAEEGKGELVETFMVGAMGQEQALRFFRQKAHKAVVTGGDRSDIILAALETPTTCLILTGDNMPPSAVLGRAEEMKTPVILVRHDTLTTIEMMESLIGRIRVHDPKKIERLREMMDAGVSLDDLLNRIK